jgi:hypothetical protein
VVVAGLLAAGTPATAQEPATVPAQWHFVDTQLRAMDKLWVGRRGFYDRSSLTLQALMLQVHVEALAVGAPPAVRRDGRIAPLIRRLLRPGTLRRRRARAARTVHVPHVPGFYDEHAQHFSIDPPIVLALARAWQVRASVPHMDRDLAHRARAVVLEIARSRFYRWPSQRRGQINWWADVEAAAAMVGRRDILRRDFPRQVNRLARARRRALPGAIAAQFNQGLGWRYEPEEGPRGTKNRTDSAEYGSLAVSLIRHERRARAAGMKALPRSTQRFLRTWSCRVLAGDWTHAGYLNWDSGLGSQREHLSRYWAHALSGLYAMATAPPSLRCAKRSNAWAAWMLDRALERYARLAGDGLIASRPWGMRGPFADPHRDPALAAARVLAIAVRFAARHPIVAPPPNLAAHDPDIRRLAITTPRYATALLGLGTPMTRGGFGLARLHARDGDLLAPIRPPVGGWLAPLVKGERRTPAGRWRVRRSSGGGFRRGAFRRIAVRGCAPKVCVTWRFDATGAFLTARLRPGRASRAYIALPTAMGAALQRLPGHAGWEARNAHGTWRLTWRRPPRRSVRLVHRGHGRHDLVFHLRRGRVTTISYRLEIT